VFGSGSSLRLTKQAPRAEAIQLQPVSLEGVSSVAACVIKTEAVRKVEDVRMKVLLRSLTVLLLISFPTIIVRAQGGVHTLFGDLHVDESKAEGIKPLVYEVVLYNIGGIVVARQFVNASGRYRFLNIANGQYYVAVLLENEEIGRTRVEIMAPVKNDFRQDLSLEWRPDPRSSLKPAAISAADLYERTTSNQKLFTKAKQATDQKHYDEAITTLQQLLTVDAKDFQAWTELGTVYLLKQNYEESERAYLRGISERPNFFLALMNLGRLRSLRGDFAGAIDPLTRALKVRPSSAEANYHLGEAYLRIKKGSKAVICFNEALKLDPIGKADAHLRLAALYNAAGMKAKAAAEYRAFLKKKPDYPERKKLEQYIANNKGRDESTNR
jgi:tetratricopeptide (TPR) repeat protein